MSHVHDLVGREFGKLIVIRQASSNERGRAQWVCRCTCSDSKYVVILGNHLLSGNTRSCGCEKLTGARRYNASFDITGKTFNRLTVLQWCGMYSLCRCTCGTEKKISSSAVRSGNIRSCGCIKREMHSKPPGIAAFNRVFALYVRQAKSRNLCWELTADDVKRLMTQCCFYSGHEPTSVMRTPTGAITYNGLDRINNLKGYTVENTVPCCAICNRMKSDMTLSDFLNHVRTIKIVQEAS